MACTLYWKGNHRMLLNKLSENLESLWILCRAAFQSDLWFLVSFCFTDSVSTVFFQTCMEGLFWFCLSWVSSRLRLWPCSVCSLAVKSCQLLSGNLNLHSVKQLLHTSVACYTKLVEQSLEFQSRSGVDKTKNSNPTEVRFATLSCVQRKII